MAANATAKSTGVDMVEGLKRYKELWDTDVIMKKNSILRRNSCWGCNIRRKYNYKDYSMAGLIKINHSDKAYLKIIMTNGRIATWKFILSLVYELGDCDYSNVASMSE